MTDNLVERLRDLGIRSADLAADHIEALTARAEAAEAREKECYEGWNFCRSLALETIARAEAAEAERDALTAENRRLREALEGAESWLDRWATHVGNCAGGGFCTCGLSLVRYETSAALKGEQK